jgi:hypothetical protein
VRPAVWGLAVEAPVRTSVLRPRTGQDRRPGRRLRSRPSARRGYCRRHIPSPRLGRPH